MKKSLLNGKVIAITRPKKEAYELARMISKLGGKPFIASTLELKPIKNKQLIKKFILKLIKEKERKNLFLIFMSQNIVSMTIKASEDLRLKNEFLKQLRRVKVVAIGPKTRIKLKSLGIKVAFMPSAYCSQGLINYFKRVRLKGKTIMILRKKYASKYLKSELKKLGAKVIQVPVYESIIPQKISNILSLINNLIKGKIHAITFMSPSAALNLLKIAREHGLSKKLKKAMNENVLIIALGPTTQKTLNKLGIKSSLMPKKYTIEGMLKTLLEFFKKKELLK
jgi:uroporphyrinogen III methyltransferase/synthase